MKLQPFPLANDGEEDFKTGAETFVEEGAKVHFGADRVVKGGMESRPVGRVGSDPMDDLSRFARPNRGGKRSPRFAQAASKFVL